MVAPTEAGAPVVLFRERQRFRQPWLWALLLGVAAVPWYGAWRQLVNRDPWGTNPMPDAGLVAVLLTFGIAFPLFFRVMELRTEVRGDGIHVRFFPLHARGKLYRWEELREVEMREYRPLAEYGGWGIRIGPAGWAYNVSGRQGIQLVTHAGLRVLIGTREPEAFIDAVREARPEAP